MKRNVEFEIANVFASRLFFSGKLLGKIPILEIQCRTFPPKNRLSEWQ